MTVVLDSWAILAHLGDEGSAAARVDELYEHERPFVSWINLGEVHYILRHAAGEDEASATVGDLRSRTRPELPSSALVLEAARIKADHAMAYADAFAAATAVAHDAELWTGDPELLIDGAAWRPVDLRD